MTMVDIEVMDLTAHDFDFAPECEHSQHADDKLSHDGGPAKWFRPPSVTPCCGSHMDGVYLCDGYYQFATQVGRFLCVECYKVVSFLDMKFVRI